jgi:hypothetical protein
MMRAVFCSAALFLFWGCQSVQTPTASSVKAHRRIGIVESSRWGDMAESNKAELQYRRDLSGLSSAKSIDQALNQNLIHHYQNSSEDWRIRTSTSPKSPSRVFSIGPEDEEGDTGIYLNPVK